jgi:hypothetical protein
MNPVKVNEPKSKFDKECPVCKKFISSKGWANHVRMHGINPDENSVNRAASILDMEKIIREEARELLKQQPEILREEARKIIRENIDKLGGSSTTEGDSRRVA